MTRFEVLVTLSILSSAASAGQLYKWVDENGNTHYGDTPPPQQEVKTIEAPREADEDEAARIRMRTQNLLDQMEIRDEQRAESAQRTQAADRKKQAQERRCSRAKAELALLKRKGRHVYIDENGDTIRIEKDQRSKMIEDLEAAIKKHC